MKTPNGTNPRKKTSPRRLATRFAAGALAIATLWAAWQWGAVQWRFARTITDLESRGFATSLEGLDESYVWPPGEENAALIYLAAYDKFVEISSGADPPLWEGDWYVDRWTPIPQPAMDGMGSFIVANAEPYEMLFDAAEFERSRYPIDLAADAEFSIDHFGPLRQLGRYLSAYAIYQSELGDSSETVQAIAALLGVAESLREEPFTISQLVRFAILPMGIGAIEEAMARLEWSEESLGALAETLRKTDVRGAVHAGLRGDVVFALAYGNPAAAEDFMDMLASQASNTEIARSFLSLSWTKITFGKAARRSSALVTASLAEASMLPYAEAIAANGEIAARVMDDSEPGGISAMELSYLPDLIVGETRIAARLRLVETAVAIERHRLTAGAVPETLDEIPHTFMKSIPLDPFDNQPIRYNTTEEGYRVYSIGENAIDDGGVEGADRYTGDIVMEVRR